MRYTSHYVISPKSYRLWDREQMRDRVESMFRYALEVKGCDMGTFEMSEPRHVEEFVTEAGVLVPEHWAVVATAEGLEVPAEGVPGISVRGRRYSL